MIAPTPWKRNGKCIEDAEHNYCCEIVFGEEEVLDLIVARVNAHDALVAQRDALVEALEAFFTGDGTWRQVFDRARAALALAKGEKT